LPDAATVQTGEGITNLTFEDGLFIKDEEKTILFPEFYFNDISTLRRLSRSLSRKKKGSKNRVRARYRLHKWHEHIANKRLVFLNNTANFYVNNFATINIPKIPLKKEIQQATHSRTAMRLCDASFGIFCNLLKQKGEKNKTEIIEHALSKV
jgi:putative transposase